MRWRCMFRYGSAILKLLGPWATATGASRCSLSQGDIVMRILSKRELKELVLYSPQHVARLEKAGQFPKRVQLGPNRVGWIEDEVLDWLRIRVELRK
ncbi:helix-turn-helix transcriptional regulator [Pseudaestuariivita atlantica]